MLFKKHKKTSPIWYAVAAIAMLLAAPNGTILKATMEDIGPLWYNVLRFGVIAVLMIPFIATALRKLTKKNLRYALLSGVAYGLAVVGYTSAIHLSKASYVSTIDLGIPILLMIYSIILTREKITKRSFMGIMIAALGGFVIVSLPALLGGSLEAGAGVAPTLLAMMNCTLFPLSVIFTRKASEAGLSLWATFGIMAYVIVAINLTAALLSGSPLPTVAAVMHPHALVAVLYSAVAVSLLARLMTVAAYKRVGATTIAGLTYIESFISIALPMVLLSERPTIEMLIGGVLIFIGVVIAEMGRRKPVIVLQKDASRHT